MQVISLFSGIEGFGEAAKELGWDVVVSCEINPFCQKVIADHWPNGYHHTDVKTLNYEIIKEKSNWNPEEPTIIVGGFPCQPYSTAGKRLGKEDERHLWPEMYRLISEVKPDFIVGENVRGLLNWSDGLVFEEVCVDLEAQGYEVWPYILPAASVNAPHRRDRIWFVAFHTDKRSARSSRKSRGLESDRSKNNDEPSEWRGQTEQHNGCNEFLRPSTNPNSNGHEPRGLGEGRQAQGEIEIQGDKWERIWIQCWGTSQQGITSNTKHLRFQHTTERGFEGEVFEESGGQGIRCSAISIESIAPISIRGIVANPGSNGSIESEYRGQPELNNENAQTRKVSTHTYGEGLQRRFWGSEQARGRQSGSACIAGWDNFPTQSPIRTGNDGFSTDSLRQRIREDSMGHLSEKEIDQIISTALTQWNNETIKAAGNAIVPQVVLNIFKSIQLLIDQNKQL